MTAANVLTLATMLGVVVTAICSYQAGRQDGHYQAEQERVQIMSGERWDGETVVVLIALDLVHRAQEFSDREGGLPVVISPYPPPGHYFVIDPSTPAAIVWSPA